MPAIRPHLPSLVLAAAMVSGIWGLCHIGCAITCSNVLIPLMAGAWGLLDRVILHHCWIMVRHTGECTYEVRVLAGVPVSRAPLCVVGKLPMALCSHRSKTAFHGVSLWSRYLPTHAMSMALLCAGTEGAARPPSDLGVCVM